MNGEVGFVVIGLRMGRNRVRMVKRTERAKLVGVVNISEGRAKEIAEEFDCNWHTDFKTFLG
ncbi:MAG: Gfo/Idh/MocA family oxidoreductase [Armatimonadota bacterium]|nr:Gfo/Idh/MocA family oxidoreductase [Armatimonadota bacterium]MDW8142641.1 Gfo/Idh/MocA family oxidoreductase [Armatimonadota bacterium]